MDDIATATGGRGPYIQDYSALNWPAPRHCKQLSLGAAWPGTSRPPEEVRPLNVEGQVREQWRPWSAPRQMGAEHLDVDAAGR